MSYRDPLRAAAERIRLQRQDMRRKRAVLTDELLGLLPKELTQRLLTVEDVLVEAPVTADNLDDVEAQIEELTAVLDAIAKHIPGIEERLAAPPRTLPVVVNQSRLEPVEPWGAHMETGPWTQTDEPKGAPWQRPASWIRHYIHALDPTAEATFDRYYVSSSDGPGITHWLRRARFTVDAMPVDLVAWNTNLTFTVPVRPNTPDLFVRSEGWLDSLAKRFFGRRDAELGDWRFDDRFLVDADDATAAKLLDDAVRKDVLIICRFDEPVINVENDLCGLRYVTDGDRDAFDAAIDLLTRIHRAEFEVELIRGGG
jgi:hypothetical protein